MLFKTPMHGDARLALSAQFSGKVETRRRSSRARPATRWCRPGACARSSRSPVRRPHRRPAEHDDRCAGAGPVRRRLPWTERLTPGAPARLSRRRRAAGPWPNTYLTLGIEHILFGFDHLLFVAALMLIVPRTGASWSKTITAFTVAHSITLALATLGWVTLPSAPVEAMIALSASLSSPRRSSAMERGESASPSRPLGGGFRFRASARFRFRRRACRARVAARRYSRWRCSSSTSASSSGSSCSSRRFSRSSPCSAVRQAIAPAGDHRVGIRHRHDRNVLGDRTCRGVLRSGRDRA